MRRGPRHTQLALCTSVPLTLRVWFNILPPLALFRLPVLFPLIPAGMCAAWAHAALQKSSVKYRRCNSVVAEWKSGGTDAGVGSTELIESSPQRSTKPDDANQLRPLILHKWTYHLTNSPARPTCVDNNKCRHDAFWALCSLVPR